MENLMVKMAEAPDIADAVLGHVVDYYLRVSQRIFDAAGDAIDIFFIGNDFGSQQGPLVGPRQFERFLLPHLRRFIELGHAYGLIDVARRAIAAGKKQEIHSQALHLPGGSSRVPGGRRAGDDGAYDLERGRADVRTIVRPRRLGPASTSASQNCILAHLAGIGDDLEALYGFQPFHGLGCPVQCLGHGTQIARPLLDLGAIGKGYAVDCAVAILREAGVTSALLHGGTSSVYGLGTMPDGQPWKAAITAPAPSEASARTDPPDAQHLAETLTELALTDAALGVSAVSGKAFRSGDRSYGHVLDPRTGEPVQRALLAAVTSPAATEADALSTALLVLGAVGLEILAEHYPGLRAWLVLPALDGTGPHRILERPEVSRQPNEPDGSIVNT